MAEPLGIWRMDLRTGVWSTDAHAVKLQTMPAPTGAMTAVVGFWPPVVCANVVNAMTAADRLAIAVAERRARSRLIS